MIISSKTKNDLRGRRKGKKKGGGGSERMGRRKDERPRSVGRGKRGDWREGEHPWGREGRRAENVNNNNSNGRGGPKEVSKCQSYPTTPVTR